MADNLTRTIARKALPRGVIALGLVSLFNDISSEMIHGLLPVFLLSVLGASLAAFLLVAARPGTASRQGKSEK